LYAYATTSFSFFAYMFCKYRIVIQLLTKLAGKKFTKDILPSAILPEAAKKAQ